MNVYEMVTAERLALAERLAALGPADWSRPSWCAGWSVRDAAAHIVSGANSTPGAFMLGLIGAGFNFDKMIAKNLTKEAGKDGPALASELRTIAAKKTKPAKAMLGEIIVHGEDILSALGTPGTHPMDHVTAALDHYVKAGAPLHSKRRAAGLRLQATDVEWSFGTGPDVTGPALSLLLAISGRSAALDDLTGDGVAGLRARL